METTLDLSADYIDIRDIIERIEELEAERDAHEETEGAATWGAANPDEHEELQGLLSVMDGLKGRGADEEWRDGWYPLSLIADHYWEDYARNEAEEVGAIQGGRAGEWPCNHIDWEEAAAELQQDYTDVEVDGNKYWVRA